MKAVTILLMCLLVSLVGCAGNSSAWVYGNPESDGVIGARLGTEVVENVEIGASTQFNPYDNSDSQTYGVYSLLHFPSGGIDPYIGAQATIGNGTWDIADTIQPVAGVSVGPVFVEWQNESLNGEDDKILFGVRFQF